jgi:hypothetical protein
MFLHQVLGSTAGGSAGEVVMGAEKDPATDQLVQHLSHFLFISVISLFFNSITFLECFSLSFLEAVLATLQLNPVR